MRDARPAAAAALPALHAQPHPMVPPPPAPAPMPAPHHAHGHGPGPGHGHGHAHGNGVANGHAPYAGAMAPPLQQPQPPIPPMAALHEASHAILPPRPTGRMPVVQRSSGWWKSWPVIVIVIAMLAIVTAVVLMVWPPGGGETRGNQSLKPPPAPDRMETNPLPPTPRSNTGGTSNGGGAGGGGPGASRDDPWGANPRRGATPSPPSIDIPDDPDPSQVPDPGPRMDASAAMTFNILRHACKRLRDCGSDDDTTAMICDQADTFPPAPVPACAAARRCLAHVDGLSCTATTDANAILTLTTQFSDCMDATRC